MWAWKRGIWTIPATNSKNRREHVVHLSSFALAQFRKLEGLRVNDWVLPGWHPEQPIDLKTLSRQVRERQRERPLAKRSSKTGTLVLPGGPWTLQDLRRTAASVMGDLGVRGEVIEPCLNHVDRSRIRRTYQRQELMEERRDTYERLGAFLGRIAHPE